MNSIQAHRALLSVSIGLLALVSGCSYLGWQKVWPADFRLGPGHYVARDNAIGDDAVWRNLWVICEVFRYDSFSRTPYRLIVDQGNVTRLNTQDLVRPGQPFALRTGTTAVTLHLAGTLNDPPPPELTLLGRMSCQDVKKKYGSIPII